MKKILTLLAFTFICSVHGLFAQQITKFAVVDTAKVYQSYFRDSTPVRNYESKKAEFQAEINRLTDEVRKLNDKKLEASKNGDDTAAMKLESQVAKKVEYLREYTNAKNSELEILKKSLKSNDEFYKKFYNVIGKVAESGGYSMVLSLQDSNSILWYSPSVDITSQVITQLGY